MKTIYAFISFFVAMFTFANVALAQQNASLNAALKVLAPKKQEYEQRLEARARDILGSQLEQGSFLISVKAQLDNKKIGARLSAFNNASRFKSLSRKLSESDIAEQFASSISSDDMIGYIANVNVNLRLDKGIDAAVEKVLNNAVAESLNLDVGRGDKVTVEKVNFGNVGTKKKVDELRQELERTKNEKLALEVKGSGSESQRLALENQKLQYEGQLRSLQGDLTREREAHVAAKSEIEKLKSELSEIDEKTLFGRVRKAVRGIEMLVTFLPIAVIAILGIGLITFLYISAQSRRSKTMFEGMQILASALGKPSGGLSGGASQKPIQVQTGREDGSRRADTDPSAALTESGFDAARRDAEASWTAAQQSPYPVLALLKEMLLTPEGVSQFMAISRAVGTEGARILWAKFPPEEIENITTQNVSVVSPATAFQLVSQVCSQAEAIRFSKPAWFQKWDLSLFVRVTDERFAQAAQTMPDISAAIALYCMPNSRAARILSLMTGQKRKTVFEHITKVQSLDESSVQEALNGATSTLEAIKDSPLDNANLVGALYLLADAGLRRDISDVVDKDANLSSKLKGIIVTMRDVLSIEKNMLGDLLASLQMEELASLVTSLSSNEQSIVASVLPQKAMLEVQHELARINASGATKKKAELTGERVQALLIEEVKNLVAEGAVVLETPQKLGRAS